MGSHFKSALLEEHIAQAIKQWHTEVKKKKKNKLQELESSHYSVATTKITTSPEIKLSDNDHEIQEISEEPVKVTIVHQNESEIGIDSKS